MQEVFIQKLQQYIADNNPDLLLTLQEEGIVNSYLSEKVASVDWLMIELLTAGTPSYIIEERCMEELTRDLRPSRYHYLISILEEEFEAHYYRFKESGILRYEVMNLMESCAAVFDTMGFTEDSEEDRHLRYIITGVIKEYLENKQ